MAINENDTYSHRWQNRDYLRGSLPKAPHCPHCNPTCPHGYPALPTGPIWVVPTPNPWRYPTTSGGNIQCSSTSTRTFNG